MVNGAAAPFAPVALPRAWRAAWPLCPISVRYRTFTSSQAAGNADRFPPAAQHSSKIRLSGRRCLAFAGGALLDTEQSSRNEVDPGFQAWCEGRPHGIPAERRAMRVSLFLTAFLALHRVKASATPDQHFDPRHPRSRGDDRQQEGPFWSALAREGGRPTKFPRSWRYSRSRGGQAGDRSAALRARPGRWSWAAPGLSHDPEGGGRRACPGACPGLLGPSTHAQSVNPG